MSDDAEKTMSFDDAILGITESPLEPSQAIPTLLQKLEDPDQRPRVLSILQKVAKSNPESLSELLQGAPDLSRKLLKIQLELGIHQKKEDGEDKMKLLAEKLSSLLGTMSDLNV